MSKPYRRGNGLWAQAIELPPTIDPDTGKLKRRRKVVSHRDKGTVIARAREVMLDLQQHGDIPTDNMTVQQWFDYWLREVAAKNVRPSAYSSYKSVVKNWVIPTIGHVRLDKVAPTTIRKVLERMEEAGLASAYRRNAHAVMSSAFADAERDGRMRRNAVELVVPPRKGRAQLTALTVPEAVNIIKRETPDKYLWATYLLTGARRGEVIGLEWDRVGDTIDLSWQLQRAHWEHRCGTLGKGEKVWPCGFQYAAYCHKKHLSVPADYEWREVKDGLYLTRPKSSAGWRIVPLVQPLAGFLEEWRSIAPSNPWGLVFTRENDNPNNPVPPVLPLDPDYVTREWRHVADSLGHGKVRLHDLRHTTVDLLYAAGVPEDVTALIVGHSAVTMTRKYRTKSDGVRERAAMLELSRYLGLST